jgi:hypothetical protein
MAPILISNTPGLRFETVRLFRSTLYRLLRIEELFNIA